MVTCEGSKIQPYLLEVNSEPAIELTGPRLEWIFEDLFASVVRVAVEPHLNTAGPLKGGNAVENDKHLFKCLDVEVRGEKGW